MEQYDGWTENRFEGVPDYNEGDSKAFRGQLLWEPSDATRILLIGNYSDNDATVGAWQHQATTRGGENGEQSVPLGLNEETSAVDCDADLVLDELDSRTGTDCFGYRDTDGDPWAGDYDRDGRVETEASGGSLNAEWEVGVVTITSITAYQKVNASRKRTPRRAPLRSSSRRSGRRPPPSRRSCARPVAPTRSTGWWAPSTSTTTSTVTTCST